MKLTKEELAAMLQQQMKTFLSEDQNAFSQLIKSTIEAKMAELRNEIIVPMGKGDVNYLKASIPDINISGGYMTTKQGSVINMNDKKNPWVAVSQEMKDWISALVKYIKNGHVDKLLSESEDEHGGYMVPEEFRALMIMYDMEDTLVWQRATVWPMSGQKMSFPKLQQNPNVSDVGFDHFAGVTFEWTEEGGTKPETEPSFGLVELIVHELAGYTEITNALLDDSVINLLNYITKIFRAAWYWITDKEFIQGTGGKKPLGIVNDPDVLTVARQAASDIQFQDVLNMEAKLPSIFDNQAVWFITKTGRAKLRGQTVSASSKELVLRENYSDLAKGYDMTILGKPALLADGKIPTLGTTGDLILGAWPWYYIGFRQDFSMDSSKHYKFRNNRTSLRASGRVDGLASIAPAFVVLSDAS